MAADHRREIDEQSGLRAWLGAALGVKMARPGELVVCAVGDGAYMFGGPTPFHYTARRYNLPVLTIVFNNGKWGGVQRSTQGMYPDEIRQWNEAPFIDLTEPPDYGMLCRACGGEAFRAGNEDELVDCLTRARETVSGGGQALIDLSIDSV
ncbi:MAG: thiamine pyrophosphate-dependent enzyme [Rhizobiaceae bacterium]